MNHGSWLSSTIRNYAALFIFLFCLLCLYVFISIGYRSVLGPVAGGAFGALFGIIYFLARGEGSSDSSFGVTPPDYRFAVVISCLYVFSLLTMYRFLSYQRPLVHYLAFGGYAGYIGYEIGVGAHRNRVVPQLLTLTFFTYWSSQLAFPAGMYGPDTVGKYLPVIESGLAEGYVSIDQIAYLGHLIYVTGVTPLLGLSAETSYYILATLVLTGTLLLLAVLDIALPRLPREVALYAALLFGCMSWTLGRGMHPNKLNFFYPLIILIGMVALTLFSSSDQTEHRRWYTIGAVITPALIFGHRFSAGAAMIFLGTIGLFVIFSRSVLQGEYESRPKGVVLGFVAAYILAIIGNPFHQGPLLDRFSGLFLSVLAPVSPSAAAGASASGGPGRYSELALDLLLANTIGQAILFGLAVFGAIVLVRRSDWEFDLVIFWIGVLAVLLLVSLVFNAADFQPQRFYSLLGLFGLNICAGAALFTVKRLGHPRLRISSFLVGVIICLFVITSLASPIAGIALSPFNDEIPHFKKYDTNQVASGGDWTRSYAEDSLSVIPAYSDIPIRQTSQTRGELIIESIEPGQRYVYSELANRTGIIVGGGLTIGGRDIVFVSSPDPSFDSVVYTNNQTTVYLRDQIG